MSAPLRRALGPGRVGLCLRIAVVLVLVVAATWVSHQMRDALNLGMMPADGERIHGAILMGLAAYVGLLAVPFVPGAEIGIAMLTAFGAAIAPLVYGATVLAMLLSYAMGRLVPITALAPLLAFLRMRKAADLVTRAAPLSHEARLSLLLDGAPPRALALALRSRYVALGLALNIPGNAVIGGGGGIMLMAGLSGVFTPLSTLLTVAIAVSPVPIAVMEVSSPFSPEPIAA